MTASAVLVLNLGLGPVFHPAAWRHPATDLKAVYDIDHYRRIARKAEAAALHAVFSADTLAVSTDQLSTSPVRYWEPLTLFSALAAGTSRIGLLVSASSTFSEPFTLARQFSSLDKISGGRVGWNIVTSALDRAAQNYGLPQLPEHDRRYERAAEFLEVVARLWDSWSADALVADRDAGILFSADKVRDIAFTGEFFSVRGPLNMPRSPQGWPVLSQAGDSEAGRDFASRVAELVYTRHTHLGDAQAFYRDVKGRAARHGRHPDHVKILSGKDVILAPTTQEALARRDELARLRSPREVLANLARTTGYDLTALGPRDPLPDLPAEAATRQGHGALGNVRRLLEQSAPADVGEFAELVALRQTGAILAGSPLAVADELERWLAAPDAIDGFVLDPVFFPSGADLLLDELIPELQRRGLFRNAYEGETLREDLGLPPLSVLAGSVYRASGLAEAS